MKKLHLLLCIIPLLLNAQENPLEMFKPLEGYIWCAEGKWGDGSNFKQEISLKFSLDNKIVKVESLGYTNKEQTEFGPRNHGIRQYDNKLRKIRFWEFDIFGNMTEGTVLQEGKNIIYNYDYGGTKLTEIWIYKNERTYDFVVGVYENGIWEQKFLETTFKGKMK